VLKSGGIARWGVEDNFKQIGAFGTSERAVVQIESGSAIADTAAQMGHGRESSR
jgi:hypothetical protein